MAKRRRKKRRIRIGRILILMIAAFLLIGLFFAGIRAVLSLFAREEEEPVAEAEPTPTEDPIYKNDLDWQYLSYNDGYYSYEDENYTSSFGIDVSYFQGEIDWQKVKAAGVEFAFIRAGYRGSTTGELHEDTCFRAHMEGAVNAGIEVGVYFFSQAVSPEEATEEAGYLLSLIQNYPVTECAFDFEVSGEDDRGAVNDSIMNTEAAAAFCQKIRESGYTPLVYGSTSFLYHGISMYQLQDSTNFWIAAYGKETPEFPYAFEIWQYSGQGKVDGIETDVDLNLRIRKK